MSTSLHPVFSTVFAVDMIVIMVDGDMPVVIVTVTL